MTLDIVALEKAQRKIEIKQVGGNGVEIAAVPDGFSLKSLKTLTDEYRIVPERRKGTIKAEDAASFIGLTSRFKNSQSVLFCKGEANKSSISASLTAVLNYNPSGPVGAGQTATIEEKLDALSEGENSLVVSKPSTDWGDHRVQYVFPISKQFKKWLEQDGEVFDQEEFATFIEDNAPDMAVATLANFPEGVFGPFDPKFATPSQMIELSRGLEVRVGANVVNKIRKSDGSVDMKFETTTSNPDGTPLNVPEWFALYIPVFEGERPRAIPARLRFRPSGPSIKWFFELFRTEEVFDEAFNETCHQVAEAVELPMFKGQPE